VLSIADYHSGRKTVQTLAMVMGLAYRPKYCGNAHCTERGKVVRAGEWLQVAPLHCTYGYDVIATIGWQRQEWRQDFGNIFTGLPAQLKISESQVRYLYYQQYHPLLACHERQHSARLQTVAEQGGLVLSLDGLAPEGGEPQLWVVRELRSGLTLRSGWLSQQDQRTFEHFLAPIAAWQLPVAAILSDKQRGLVPAIQTVFPGTKHAFCHSHYLNNIAAPIAEADQAMKVSLRKAVRQAVGELVRAEQEETKGVLMVTGLLPTPVGEELRPPAPVAQGELAATDSPCRETAAQSAAPEAVPMQPTAEAALQSEVGPAAAVQAEREEIVQAFHRRVRYLLTLKGRPPFCLAGLEMYERLGEVRAGLSRLLAHAPDARLGRLQQGLDQALLDIAPTYTHLRQAGAWLRDIATLLDTEGKATRTGAAVRRELLAYVDDILEHNQDNPVLYPFAHHIEKTTRSYAPGLFHTYDVEGLPSSNNERESEFRDLNRRLLRTTGQKGATRRLMLRSGAWELIPRPGTFSETVVALAGVEAEELQKERERVRTHRKRFRLHTRSAKQSRKQLDKLVEQWLNLAPPEKPPE